MRAPGPLVISRMRSASRIASSTSWVIMKAVCVGLRDQARDLVLQRAAGQRIQRAEGLVHQQHLRVRAPARGRCRRAASSRPRAAPACGRGRCARPTRFQRRARRLVAASPCPSRDAGRTARRRRSLPPSSRASAHGPGRSPRGRARGRRSPARPRSPPPSSGASSPARMFRTVVLPQPECPTRQTNSPRATPNQTSSKTVVAPIAARRCPRPRRRGVARSRAHSCHGHGAAPRSAEQPVQQQPDDADHQDGDDDVGDATGCSTGSTPSSRCPCRPRASPPPRSPARRCRWRCACPSGWSAPRPAG